jgi:hypothetical protein
MWYMGLMLPASQNRLLEHLYRNNHGRLLNWNFTTRRAGSEHSYRDEKSVYVSKMWYGEKSCKEVQITRDLQKEKQLHVVPARHSCRDEKSVYASKMWYGEKSSEEVQITRDLQKERQLHVVPHHPPRCCTIELLHFFFIAKVYFFFIAKVQKTMMMMWFLAVAAVDIAVDNGWMELLAAGDDRCCLGESLVAMVVSRLQSALEK